MVPYIHKGPLDTHHVGIAWDGSRLAARALRDAMPFLMGAKAVTVIAVNEEASEASSDQLVGHLARRGIAARVQRLAVERGDVQGAILSIAAESNMGLLVMGGYGHSRLHERILGGVTTVRHVRSCRTDCVADGVIRLSPLHHMAIPRRRRTIRWHEALLDLGYPGRGELCALGEPSFGSREPCDHPTDREIVALGRRHFHLGEPVR